MPDFPGDTTEDQDHKETLEDLREELISLSVRGKIRNTEKSLRKATQRQLERIKREYERAETAVLDELVSKYLIGGLSNIMTSLDYIDEGDASKMEETLMGNDLIKRDLGDISGYVTRNIKYIGIFTMVAVVGGYMIAKRYGQPTEQEQETSVEERQDSQRRETPEDRPGDG